MKGRPTSRGTGRKQHATANRGPGRLAGIWPVVAQRLWQEHQFSRISWAADVIIIILKSGGIWQRGWCARVWVHLFSEHRGLTSSRTYWCLNSLTCTKHTWKYKNSHLLCLGNLLILINLKGFQQFVFVKHSDMLRIRSNLNAKFYYNISYDYYSRDSQVRSSYNSTPLISRRCCIL